MRNFILGINKTQMSKSKFQNQNSNLKVYEIILGLSITIFVIFFSFLSIKRYQTLNSYYYDLGIMNQVVYNTSQGRFLEMTNQDLKRNISRFAIHFDPILAVFAPFYKIYSGPEILLVGQALILGLGALAVYLLSVKILKKQQISLIFSISYLLYFAVQRAVLFDFHAVTLATTFLLFTFYFLETKKYNLYYLFIILCLLTKEHIGLIVFMLGLYLFFIKKDNKQGIITSLTGLVFFIATVYIIIPYFRGSEHFASNYFVDINIRLRSIVLSGIDYTKMIFIPVIYSVFSPLSLMIALPEWAINTLSANGNQRSFFFHYNSVIVAIIFYSLILGFKNFNDVIKNQKIRIMVFTAFIFFSLRSIYLFNPVPSLVRYPVKYRELDLVAKTSLNTWIQNLSNENIKVSTTPKLAPFFTKRRFYINFLFDSAFSEIGLTNEDILKTIDNYKMADYIIIYRPEIGDLNSQKLPVKYYQRLREDIEYQMIYSDDRDEKSLEVYRKI
jgi:uncharacterized membrane protein